MGSGRCGLPRAAVVGIRIHGLKDSEGYIASAGGNPFDHLTYGKEENKEKLSEIVKCYNPQGSNRSLGNTNRQTRYEWISEHLENAVEEAIRIRENN